MLVGYAEKTLLGVLNKSVLAVSENERHIQSLKRKREVIDLAADYRLSNKRTTVAPLGHTGDPSTSFGMSQVDLAGH